MYGKKIKSYLLLIMVLTVQMAFGQLKGMMIYLSDGNIVKLAVSQIDSINFKNNVVDIDSNVYKIIQIGDQCWLAENLKVTHYRNGDPIPNVTDATEWNALTTGAYCNYDNNSSNAEIYGRLYNWFAVTDSRNIAPEGWHVPSDAEWDTLVNYLGGFDVAGGKLKATGTTYWASPNEGATNESGFTALPAGLRGYNGTFGSLVEGYSALFWSSTECDGGSAWRRALYYGHDDINRYNDNKPWGFSVRLVRD
ncbi:MAG: fibrobacter succinogenes major paralogous domain-containing protein [Candidatus Marinimicrobia bacterium]|jgi:uncharacterized protein (TIGR02145 family)|nr:fibrobacter succinogenes major paralogous domain-containing protein [Candidatus Neomarinimicrobiota bacterium]MCK9560636.1 fibrobacter succinogenes major paralogous domain-containing protein [Candidatus Neomarinimicrobiota bacterium]MDD5231403.1 fibrobacter succinogenes major paralogous domain-containing protein [Candidatus Neomarinimicrobiota bacterium]